MKATIRQIASSLLFAASAVSLPALAATDISFSGLGGAEYDTAGVYFFGDVNYTATFNDGGGFDLVKFELWDDGGVGPKFDQTFSLLVGTSGSFHVTASYPGLVGTKNPGIGLYLYDLPDTTEPATYVDPFYLQHYSDPSQCRVDCGPVPGIPEPSTYAMMLLGLGAVVVGARRKSRRS